jgi:taurine dioxygenase
LDSRQVERRYGIQRVTKSKGANFATLDLPAGAVSEIQIQNAFGVGFRPTSGGDTQYVNMHDAYDDLPEAPKRKIDGLKAVHVYQSKYSPRSLGTINEESRRNLPPPGIHPLVRTHPENGRKALFLNPVRMESIIGMEDKEALALIDELMRHATQRKYEYRHKWRHGDWVMWDNRSVIHQANPDYDMRERRYLYRLLLKGEMPV